MKRVVVCLMVLGMMLTSCSQATAKPIITGETTTPLPIAIQTPAPSPVPQATQSLIVPPVQGAVTLDQLKMPEAFYASASNAVAPGDICIRVTVDDLLNGKTKEWPVYVHNGDGLQVKLLQVDTEIGETFASIPVNVILANSGLLDIISIESTLPNERLEAIAYDASTKLLTIKNFIPQSKRVVKITYKTLASFRLEYSLRAEGQKGYVLASTQIKDWFTVDQSLVTLRPFETRTINAKLTIAPRTQIPSGKYIFWVSAISTSILPSQVTAEIGNSQRVFVDVE